MEFHVNHVYREGNVVADFLAKRGARGSDMDWYNDSDHLPSQLHGLLIMDRIGVSYLFPKSKAKPLHISIQDRSSRCKFSLLKLVLLVIVSGAFVKLLHSPDVYNSNGLAHSGSRSSFVDRWIWGGQDPRYRSNLDIEWDDIMKVLEKVTENHEKWGIGLVNFNNREIDHWKQLIPDAKHIVPHLDYAEKNVTWASLYPEWIDEEEETEVPICPSLPKIDATGIRLNLIAVKLPCRNEGNWSRDVGRLHLQLAAADLAASFKGLYPVHLLFITKCFPIPNLFTCKELIAHQGNAWLYKPGLHALREKVHLPVGSCELALPLRGNGIVGLVHPDSTISQTFSSSDFRNALILTFQSNLVDRWIWGGQDPHYRSNLNIEWDDIMKVLEKVTKNHEKWGIGLVNFNNREIDEAAYS
ncbi:UDP-glucuronate:xylan alpha-glucuronosyltransferase 1-like [Juglans microcarpa x Juglans regia]|uniref:UDP-glucuronate:xylan alpha-glucuronosyltransferase 1-like n=1 Tax=Juglans microcarpa x Juglans regia TaxID=2249226 RepID=UPI001B7F5000|nr:UDP-glucuronate:xylan alpha-glucuronosyltransferase 1-like [Juglans microcarpa x Juglans regia]